MTKRVLSGFRCDGSRLTAKALLNGVEDFVARAAAQGIAQALGKGRSLACDTGWQVCLQTLRVRCREQGEGAFGQAALINRFLADSVGVAQEPFLGEPQHGAETGYVSWCGNAKGIGFMFADQINDKQAARLRKTVVQRHQDARDILVEVLNMKIRCHGAYCR